MNIDEAKTILSIAQAKLLYKKVINQYRDKLQFTYSLRFYNTKIVEVETNKIIYKEPLPLMILGEIIGKGVDALYQYIRRKDKYVDIVKKGGKEYNVVIGLPAGLDREIQLDDWDELVSIFFGADENE